MTQQSDDQASVAPALAAPLKSLVLLFEHLQIPYALVDGLAAMVYGRARFTEDINIVAASSCEQIPGNRSDLMRVFHFDPSSTWKLYHESGVEIDIWKDQHSDDIARRAHLVQFGAQQVRIAEVHDLVAMKLRAGRLQDDYDISEILKRTPLEEAVLRDRITDEQLAQFHRIKSRTRF